MTAEYLQELKKKGSNVARDYDLILNEFSSIPRARKLYHCLGECFSGYTRLPKGEGGISLVELLHYWGRHLVNSLAHWPF